MSLTEFTFKLDEVNVNSKRNSIKTKFNDLHRINEIKWNSIFERKEKNKLFFLKDPKTFQVHIGSPLSVCTSTD